MPRPSARQRGYDSRWDKARATFLKRNPWCHMCKTDGKSTRATTVDHHVPHRGDSKLFWDTNNWRSVCTPHHSSTKQRDENRGITTGCDAHGLPIDSEHHWS